VSNGSRKKTSRRGAKAQRKTQKTPFARKPRKEDFPITDYTNVRIAQILIAIAIMLYALEFQVLPFVVSIS
jgi:hypothetical protein